MKNYLLILALLIVGCGNRHSQQVATTQSIETGATDSTAEHVTEEPDIEILPDDDGAPHVKLYGYFAYIATKRKIYNIFISLSHCKEYAVAQAILEG